MPQDAVGKRAVLLIANHTSYAHDATVKWDTKVIKPKKSSLVEGSGYTFYIFDPAYGVGGVPPQGSLVAFAMPFAMYLSQNGVPVCAQCIMPNSASALAAGERNSIASQLITASLIAFIWPALNYF
ncbi:hypothetical protein GQ42DRAFT_86501 [Ramicandelaber brevisporus]|nr:hypothetical protein GQ42DRAFT_86501 [Ramicandelaber brevisporus]